MKKLIRSHFCIILSLGMLLFFFPKVLRAGVFHEILTNEIRHLHGEISEKEFQKKKDALFSQLKGFVSNIDQKIFNQRILERKTQPIILKVRYPVYNPPNCNFKGGSISIPSHIKAKLFEFLGSPGIQKTKIEVFHEISKDYYCAHLQICPWSQLPDHFLAIVQFFKGGFPVSISSLRFLKNPKQIPYFHDSIERLVREKRIKLEMIDEILFSFNPYTESFNWEVSVITNESMFSLDETRYYIPFADSEVISEAKYVVKY